MAEDLRDMTLKLHFEAQVKFCYYLLGLAAALLGLSVQFATPSSTDVYPILVFISWCALIVSIFAGIKWQQLWIKYTAELHSGLVNLHKKNEDTDLNNTEHSDISIKMFISEIIQAGMLIIGLVLFGVFKVVNFYV